MWLSPAIRYKNILLSVVHTSHTFFCYIQYIGVIVESAG